MSIHGNLSQFELTNVNCVPKLKEQTLLVLQSTKWPEHTLEESVGIKSLWFTCVIQVPQWRLLTSLLHAESVENLFHWWIRSVLAALSNACLWHFSDFNGDSNLKNLGLVQNVSKTLTTHYVGTVFMNESLYAENGGRLVVTSCEYDLLTMTELEARNQRLPSGWWRVNMI